MPLNRKAIPFLFILLAGVAILIYRQSTPAQDEGKPVTLREFNEKVKNDKKSVLVYISASWCSVCGRVKPVISDIEQEYADRVEVLRIDADRDKEVAEEYEIHSLPVLMLFHHGNREWIHLGIIDKGKLKEKINPYCWD